MASVTAKTRRPLPPPEPQCGELHPLFMDGPVVLRCDAPRGHLPGGIHTVTLGWDGYTKLLPRLHSQMRP